MNEKPACGACARIGTNDTSGPRAHSPGCANDPDARPSHGPLGGSCTLGEANEIEGYARALTDACGRLDRALRQCVMSASGRNEAPKLRREINHAAMDRDVALGKLGSALLPILKRSNARARGEIGGGK